MRIAFVPASGAHSAMPLMAALTLCACGPPPSVNSPSPSATSLPAESKSDDSDGETSAPAADTTKTAPVAPTTPKAEASPPPAETSFSIHPILDGGGGSMHLSHNKAPYFVKSWGPGRGIVYRSSLGGPFVRQASMLEGLDGINVHAIYGGIEPGAIAIGNQMQSRIGYSVVYERTAKGWKHLESENPGVHYVSVQRWVGGRYLAYVEGAYHRNDTPPAYFKLLKGSEKGVQLPKVKLAEAPKPDPNKKTKRIGLRGGPTAAVPARTMVAFESGHVVVIGKAKYEHFSPGSSKGRVGNLPDDSDYGPRFAKTGSHSLAVILKSSVGHFDGTRWHRWPMPEGTKPIDLAWHDGSWWLLTETDLYRRQSSSWHAVNLPVEQAPGHQGHAFRRMGAAGGELFISGSVKLEGRKKEFERLWSTHPASQGLQALDAAGAGSGVGTRASATEPPPAPQSAGACDHVFAMFFAVGSQVPLKHDFPKVRKALTGQNQFAQARFVRTEENGKHYFGAFVPNREVGRKLSRHVGLHVAHAKPSLLCHKPKVVGELAIDLKTGRARGWKK